MKTPHNGDDSYVRARHTELIAASARNQPAAGLRKGRETDKQPAGVVFGGGGGGGVPEGGVHHARETVPRSGHQPVR